MCFFAACGMSHFVTHRLLIEVMTTYEATSMEYVRISGRCVGNLAAAKRLSIDYRSMAAPGRQDRQVTAGHHSCEVRTL